MAPRMTAFLAFLALTTLNYAGVYGKVQSGSGNTATIEGVTAAPLLAYGVQASAGQFPWMAALVGQSTLCGGTLINASIVLTAGKTSRVFSS